MSDSTKRRRANKRDFFHLSTDRFIFFVTLVYIVYAFFPKMIYDHDTFFHIKMGEYIVSHGIVWKDVFTYTAVDFKAYSWLAEILFYGLHSALGTLGIGLIQPLFPLAVFLILHRVLERETASARLSCVLPLLVLFSAFNWWTRPQLFSFVFAALYVAILHDGVKEKSRALLALPVIMIFWANIHIYFIVGWLLFGFFIFDEIIAHPERPLMERLREQRFAGAIFLATLAAPILNPYHFHIYPLLLKMALEGSGWFVKEIVHEAQIPTFNLLGVKVVIALALAGAAAFIFSRRRPRWTHLLLFGAVLFRSLTYARDLVYFGIILTPLLGKYLNEIPYPRWQALLHPERLEDLDDVRGQERCVRAQLGNPRRCLRHYRPLHLWRYSFRGSRRAGRVPRLQGVLPDRRGSIRAGQ